MNRQQQHQQHHSQAIRLNNQGVSLLANGRGREASACFTKSLGMIKALLSEQQQQQQQTMSIMTTKDRPRHHHHDHYQNQPCTHESEMMSSSLMASSSSSLANMKQNNNITITSTEQEEAKERTRVLHYHKAVSLAAGSQNNQPRPQEGLFLTYQNALLLQDPNTETTKMCLVSDTNTDSQEQVLQEYTSTSSSMLITMLTSHSACVIFNMALLHQRLGSLDKAEQLYRLVIRVLQGFATSLLAAAAPRDTTITNRNSSTDCLDGTCLLIMLASLNNISYLLYFHHPSAPAGAAAAGNNGHHHEQDERVAEASHNIQFLSRLLNIIVREDMLFDNDVVSEAEWSTFVLNALLADPHQGLMRQAGAAPAA